MSWRRIGLAGDGNPREGEEEGGGVVAVVVAVVVMESRLRRRTDSTSGSGVAFPFYPSNSLNNMI